MSKENNESNLNKAIALEFGMKAKDADAIVDFLQNWIIETALEKGEAKLHKYGKFTLVERGARKGRNPRTGETIELAPSKTVRFSLFKASKDLLNA